MVSRYTSNWNLAFQLLLLAPLVCGLVNVTVDDTGVDPLSGHSIEFLPSGYWNAAIGGCPQCSSKPDPTQTHNLTWHDATYWPWPG